MLANNLREFTKTIEHLQLNIQKLFYHAPITREQLQDLQQQIQLLTQKAKEANYSFHWMVEMEGIRIEHAFMKA
jgi:hypothetical protein